VVAVAESRASKSLLQEKETLITDLQNELNQARCYSHPPKTFDVLNYTLPFATKKKHVKSNKRTEIKEYTRDCLELLSLPKGDSVSSF